LKWDRKKTVLLSRAEDRRRAARVKDANNEAYESFELTFNNRNLSELAAVQTFWDDHHPDKRFIFTDSHRSIRKVVYFDSDIAHDAAATCATTYSFRVIEG
jgi:peptide methionine sulfoxide reductase MsrA